MDETRELRKALYHIEGDNHPAIGYSYGDTWNGWEKPLFTEDCIAEYLRANDWTFKFDRETLIILFDDGTDTYHSEVYTLPDGSIARLWNIEGLTWQEFTR